MKKEQHSKIKTIRDLGIILEDLRKKGKKIVHCHGCFDLLHPGHIKHFQAAKRKGDILVVTLTKDEYVNKGPGRPIFNHHLRADSIAALECVDYVAINEWPAATEAIKIIKPDLYVKGSDYSNKDGDITGKIYEEEEAVKSVGGMLHFTDEASFSSTSLINMFLSPYPQEAREFFHNFRKRYSADNIIERIKSVKKLKVLIVGDIIIDEYHYCVGMGKSQKDYIIATKFLNAEVFAGGVLAAANHIAGFCEDVTLLSCIGLKNNYNDFITSHLKPNIKQVFYFRKDVPTVVKRRFVDPSFVTKLFEICFLEDLMPMPKEIEDDICDNINKTIKNYDMVLVTDFGHGMVTPKITKLLSEKAKFFAVNVQTNSANLGFNLITKVNKADFICIDEPEARLACHDKTSNIERLIVDLSKKTNCDKIIITRGHKGSLAYSEKEGFCEIPVFSKDVVDRIGAGDAFFSIAAPCACNNSPMDITGFVGNAVGALKVLIVGNRSSVEPIPLFKYITTLLK
ncbi:MAG: PfkB family carbohydrate kinase [bacterium]